MLESKREGRTHYIFGFVSQVAVKSVPVKATNKKSPQREIGWGGRGEEGAPEVLCLALISDAALM